MNLIQTQKAFNTAGIDFFLSEVLSLHIALYHQYVRDQKHSFLSNLIMFISMLLWIHDYLPHNSSKKPRNCRSLSVMSQCNSDLMLFLGVVIPSVIEIVDPIMWIIQFVDLHSSPAWLRHNIGHSLSIWSIKATCCKQYEVFVNMADSCLLVKIYAADVALWYFFLNCYAHVCCTQIRLYYRAPSPPLSSLQTDRSKAANLHARPTISFW